MARPTRYKKEYAEQAEKLCKLGMIDTELAEYFECAESTLNKWKLAHPEFSESIKRGKTLADANVASKLYERAMGYEVDTSKVMQHQGIPFSVPYIEKYAPDVIAAIFWLKNRQPKKWRNNPEYDGGDEVVTPVRVLLVAEDARKDGDTGDTE